jgi:predicted transcriptional regulator
MKKSSRLGELQLAILKVLWERGSATVNEVHEALRWPEPLAYTTVATMLRKMEARSLVDHEVDGRRFIYGAAVEQEEVNRSMAHDVLERLFEGSLSGLVSHLLETRKVSRAELEELSKLIQERKKRRS